MNADELMKLTTDALDQRSRALEQHHSEQLTALLQTMLRFRRDVCRILNQLNSRYTVRVPLLRPLQREDRMNLPDRLHGFAAVLAARFRELRALMREIKERVAGHGYRQGFRAIVGVALHAV